MGRVAITEENRTGQGGDRFPQMKLKTNEKARFFIFEEPWSQWIHELRAPEIVGGVAVMETKFKKDKTSYEVIKQQFIRRSICFGDGEVMKQNGLDPANCRACEASVESGGDVAKPVPRFAVPVIRYKLQGSTWNVQTPFSAEILVWSATARMWDSIIELQGKIGDLRLHDLTLDCEDGDWQRNKLSFEMDAAYLASNETKLYIKQLLSGPGNRPTDDQLRDACGSVATKSYMEQDVSLILSRWRQAHNSGTGNGQAAPLPATTAPVDLGAGIDSLLGANPANNPVQVAYAAHQNGATSEQALEAARAAAAGVDPNDPLAMFAPSQPVPGTSAASPAQPSAQTATAVVPPSPAPAPGAEDLSFEALLGL